MDDNLSELLELLNVANTRRFVENISKIAITTAVNNYENIVSERKELIEQYLKASRLLPRKKKKAYRKELKWKLNLNSYSLHSLGMSGVPEISELFNSNSGGKE